MMKKALWVAGSAISYLAVTAATALAQSTLPEPQGPVVEGTVVNPPSATAFTGADVGVLLVAVLALAGLGILLIRFGRRRAASAA